MSNTCILSLLPGSYQLGFEYIQQPREVVELRGRGMEVDHAETGSEATPLTHTHVHVPPVLLNLDEHRGNTDGRGRERERERKREKDSFSHLSFSVTWLTIGYC